MKIKSIAMGWILVAGLVFHAPGYAGDMMPSDALEVKVAAEKEGGGMVTSVAMDVKPAGEALAVQPALGTYPSGGWGVKAIVTPADNPAVFMSGRLNYLPVPTDPGLETKPQRRFSIPEPAAMLLLGTGLLGLAEVRRRRRSGK